MKKKDTPRPIISPPPFEKKGNVMDFCNNSANGSNMVQTYTLEGLKKLLRGNVSEKTLEHYKTQGWLVPDHVTPGNIRRYGLGVYEVGEFETRQLVNLPK